MRVHDATNALDRAAQDLRKARTMLSPACWRGVHMPIEERDRLEKGLREVARELRLHDQDDQDLLGAIVAALEAAVSRPANTCPTCRENTTELRRLLQEAVRRLRG